ncbi:hypothetical protein [Flavobacterium phycosphaerae]|uniref:hypothetical protein n=1 Tax=Flavobacterium phycosphaerae TaxID=2697515 RepID=UPI001389E225|nr:hypothetical protein [Flavobacterium phycosphaerae]
MRKLIILFFVGLAITVSSCRQDFVFEPSTGDLTFSKDTVYLDTVFNTIGSSTYTLKVYNHSDKDIKIPLIQLGKGQDSKYRMTVDGMTGDNNRVFHNVELLAKDSLFIFIEITNNVPDVNPTQFLYTDQIQFDTGANFQKVELVTLIQDAYFLYPKKFDDGTTETLPIGDDEIYGFYLDENDPINGNEYVWGNDKPYVVYGYAAVPGGKTLNVMPGARIHFHADSGLIVGNGATLKVNGDYSTTDALEKEVIFEGDRLEPDFSDVPGQWGTIWLTDGSTNNEINHLTIKNSTVGLLIDHNDGNYMTIKNTQIYDSSLRGIYAKTAKIKGENIVINTAGQYALSCSLGGSYEFKHCTFNNNWSSSNQLAVLIDNYYKDENNQQVAFDLEQADFYNCIIFGSNQIEMLMLKSTVSPETNWTAPLFSKCQIKFNNTNSAYANDANYTFLNDATNIIKNGKPDFQNLYKNKMMIGDDSAGNGFGADVGVSTDLINTARVSPNIDLGAYQHITFPAPTD